MTTPANFNTPSRIIQFAMKDAGLLQEGDRPNGDDLAQYISRLNDMVNMWQTQGLKLWLNSVQAVTLVAGTGSYTLGPAGSIITVKPTRVIEGYYISSSNISRQLDTLSWEGYNSLPNATQQGAIVAYFVDKQQANLVVKTWLVPDTGAAAGRMDLLIQQQVTGAVSLNDTMGFPLEWYMALRWGLADDICGGQSQAIMQRCAQKAESFRSSLEDWDVEDASTTFGVDTAQASNRNPFSTR
jgi:hypothetical protein